MTINKFAVSAFLLPVALLLVGGMLFSSPLPVPTAPRASEDTTKSEPLRPLMVELAQDMDRIETGLWHEDYGLIEEGANSIANHPKISPEQLAKIKKSLGEGFQGFVSMDKAVHKSATELVDAARARDWSKVLDVHERLKRGCTSCHTAYREGLRPVLAPTN